MRRSASFIAAAIVAVAAGLGVTAGCRPPQDPDAGATVDTEGEDPALAREMRDARAIQSPVVRDDAFRQIYDRALARQRHRQAREAAMSLSGTKDRDVLLKSLIEVDIGLDDIVEAEAAMEALSSPADRDAARETIVREIRRRHEH